MQWESWGRNLKVTDPLWQVAFLLTATTLNSVFTYLIVHDQLAEASGWPPTFGQVFAALSIVTLVLSTFSRAIDIGERVTIKSRWINYVIRASALTTINLVF